MLMTMEEEAERQKVLMPSPERLDSVSKRHLPKAVIT